MLNRLITALFILIICHTTAVASDGVFTFIQKGTEAPFTGTLFDPAATANNTSTKKQQKQFDLDISQIRITLDTEREGFQKTLEVKNREIEQLNKIIAKKPGTNALLWGIIGGFAVGVATTVGITYAVNK